SLLFFLYVVASLLILYSFPTRRSSDLDGFAAAGGRPHRHGFVERLVGHEVFSSPRGPHCDRHRRADSFCWRHQKESARRWRSQRSEEHTSELQSRRDLVCRLLLEKKKT